MAKSLIPALYGGKYDDVVKAIEDLSCPLSEKRYFPERRGFISSTESPFEAFLRKPSQKIADLLIEHGLPLDYEDVSALKSLQIKDGKVSPQHSMGLYLLEGLCKKPDYVSCHINMTYRRKGQFAPEVENLLEILSARTSLHIQNQQRQSAQQTIDEHPARIQELSDRLNAAAEKVSFDVPQAEKPESRTHGKRLKI